MDGRIILFFALLATPMLAVSQFPTGTNVEPGKTEPPAWVKNQQEMYKQSDTPRDSTGSSYEGTRNTARPARPYERPVDSNSVYLDCDSSVQVQTTKGSKRVKANCTRSKSTSSSSSSRSSSRSTKFKSDAVGPRKGG